MPHPNKRSTSTQLGDAISMTDRPEFKPLEQYVSTAGMMGHPAEISKAVGLWCGSRFIYPVGNQAGAAGAWHQPFIAVGRYAVWTGDPVPDADSARDIAVAQLAGKLSKLLSDDALQLA